MSVSPTALRTKDAHHLEIVWPSETCVIPYRTLRLECPCAGCINEMTGEKMLDPASVPSDVRVTGAHTLGRYAVQFQWSDGHGTGIYHYDRLWSLTHPDPSAQKHHEHSDHCQH